jgi:SAM-dependent methyltransferase
MDHIASMNKATWEAAVLRREGNARPILDLDCQLVKLYSLGELDVIPKDLRRVFPPTVLKNIAGKDVLCLGAGGGQQSPIFGLLGARVTVLDLAEGQLAGDRTAATHYGYPVRTIQGDMRDLSCFEPETFDVVYQSCTCWIPDVRVVYQEVLRVLRPGGLYRVDFTNPLWEFYDHPAAKERRIPYSVKEMVYHFEDRPDCIQFRHHLSDIFNGLIATGFALEEVIDPNGEWFVILARKKPEPSISASWVGAST